MQLNSCHELSRKLGDFLTNFNFWWSLKRAIPRLNGLFNKNYSGSGGWKSWQKIIGLIS